MSDQRKNALKTILQLTCQLFWVVGLVVGMGGVYLLMKYKQSSVFLSQSHFPLPAYLALASAVLILVCGGLGSWLSIRDSIFLQGLFVYLLVLVFCLENTASALAFFHTTKLESELTPLSGVFHNYTGSGHDPDSQAVDATQAELQCCGVHGYRDWLETSWFNSTGGLVPHSCCNSTFTSCNGAVDQPWQLYTQGCQVKLEKSLQFVLRFIIWGSPIVFFVEVVLFLTMAQLMTQTDQTVMEYRILGKN